MGKVKHVTEVLGFPSSGPPPKSLFLSNSCAITVGNKILPKICPSLPLPTTLGLFQLGGLPQEGPSFLFEKSGL